jgi:hypothetical protein
VTLAIQVAKSNLRKLIFLLTQFFQNSIPFVNCSMRTAGSMSNRKGRTNNHGNQEGSQEGTGKEGGTSEESRQEEVTNGNRQHIRGTR